MPGPEFGRDRLAAWYARELPQRLPQWLPRQRWFGGKARRIAGATVEDLIWLPATPAVALLIVQIAYEPDGGDRYALLLGVTGGSADEPLGELSGVGAVVDQAGDGAAVLALLSGLLDAPATEGARGGSLIYADTSVAARQMLSDAAPPGVRPVSAEQSNTSVRIGAGHVFKLFRRLDAGEHPQLEMGRYLALAGFRAVPPLEGALVYRAADGQESAIGALEGWVANEGDGWHYVLGQLEASQSDPGARPDLYADLVALGETTAAFHEALAAATPLEAFAPEPVTAADAARWVQDAEMQAARTYGLLAQRLSTLTPDVARLAQAVLDGRFSLPHQPLDEPAAHDFVRCRIHGDYHLGQTLKTPGGFVIIDFEGEPSKPLAARRQKQCALRDVAGMLRSLDYAVAAAGEGGAAGASDPASVSALRLAFLEGYHREAAHRGASFLPSDTGARDAWVGLFEFEKALYEVEYELNNRPAWVHIPLAALLRLRSRGPRA